MSASLYDVLIVGAGPAGSGLALLLARRGLRVLLLDRAHFPRYKACGGGLDGIAQRALDAMGVDTSPLEQAAPAELIITNQGRHPALYRFERPLARMVMRADLDALISQVAVLHGAQFHDGEAVRSIKDNGAGISVETDLGCYQSRLLVGADGVSSLVARAFRLNPNPIVYVLRAAEVTVDLSIQTFWAGRTQIDLSVWPLGYSWVFPKADHLSIGTGLPKAYAKQLKLSFERLVERAGLGAIDVLEQRSHFIAFRRGRAPIVRDRVLLVGDAAGLIDPNTGGGIGWALESSRLAAAQIVAYLAGETDSLRGYQKAIDRELGREFRAARILRNTILFRLILTRGRATGDASLWHEVVRVIQADESYQQWFAHSKLAPLLSWTGAIPL